MRENKHTATPDVPSHDHWIVSSRPGGSLRCIGLRRSLCIMQTHLICCNMMYRAFGLTSFLLMRDKWELLKSGRSKEPLCTVKNVQFCDPGYKWFRAGCCPRAASCITLFWNHETKTTTVYRLSPEQSQLFLSTETTPRDKSNV
jgi:hypothetical protein